MDEKVYEAAITGNVSSLSSLLSEDPNILDRVLVGEAAKETPLHMAAQFGHVDFVKEILKEKPEFAGQLNTQGRTPLHVASAKGHTQVVKALLEKDTQACFVRDRDGMIPLHLAAIKGRVEAMKDLVKSKTATILMATDGGVPLLHLCLKHDQFEAVKTLIEIAGDDREFMSLKDEDDNTVLNLLAAMGQDEVIEFLLDKKASFDIDAMNVHGSTALDEVKHIDGRFRRMRIRKLLRQIAGTRSPSSSTLKRRSKTQIETERGGIHKIRDALLVVAILIATLTFQAIVNPPGGVWQDDGTHKVRGTDGTTMEVNHYAGEAIMAYKFPKEYKLFRSFNTIGFVASLLLIILLFSGFSFHGKGSQRAWTAVTWITIAAMMAVYIFAFNTIASDDINMNTVGPLGDPLPSPPKSSAPPSPRIQEPNPNDSHSGGLTVPLPLIVSSVILVVGIAYVAVFFPLLLKEFFRRISKLFHRLRMWQCASRCCITSPV